LITTEDRVLSEFSTTRRLISLLQPLYTWSISADVGHFCARYKYIDFDLQNSILRAVFEVNLVYSTTCSGGEQWQSLYMASVMIYNVWLYTGLADLLIHTPDDETQPSQSTTTKQLN